jgi:hypothetical protein
VYAYEYSPNYVDGLRIKIRMLMNLILTIILNCILFIFVHSFLKIKYSIFDVYESIINLVNFANVDLIFFILILYTFRARSIPETFYIQLATSENLFKKELVKYIIYFRIKLMYIKSNQIQKH